MKYIIEKSEAGTFWRNEKGDLHREDGPAVENVNGNRLWLLNGAYHRVDGPACEWADGVKSWWLNGQRHREDGPAIEWADGNKSWWLNGQQLSEAEFNARTKATTSLGSMAKAITGFVTF